MFCIVERSRQGWGPSVVAVGQRGKRVDTAVQLNTVHNASSSAEHCT